MGLIGWLKSIFRISTTTADLFRKTDALLERIRVLEANQPQASFVGNRGQVSITLFRTSWEMLIEKIHYPEREVGPFWAIVQRIEEELRNTGEEGNE